MSSEPHEGAPGQSSAVSVAREQAHDLMRTLLDVLLRVAPAAASKEEWLVEGGIKSWCGAAEVLREPHWLPTIVSLVSESVLFKLLLL